jgi:predicted nucleotide-binding protein (sugar kinase/HSP70/actin superfamily)
MPVKIGIPRGLFYYKFHPLWKTFYEELGAEIIVSPATSKKILDEGVKHCVDEACLPVKVYHGHVASLRGRVDFVFVPRFTSISRGEYVCPKFGGLPDMVRNTLKEIPPLIDTEIYLRKSNKQLRTAALEAGSFISGDRVRILKAFDKAMKVQKEYDTRLGAGLSPLELLEGRTRKNEPVDSFPRLKIGVIGHTYNLWDSYVNMSLFSKLSRLGVETVTLDMVDRNTIDAYASALPKKLFWYFGRKAVGGTMQMAASKDIDGMIYVMSFGCGVDSFTGDLAERKARAAGLPFTVLTLDEHSGEAGMNTRLEAFIDLLARRKKFGVKA